MHGLQSSNYCLVCACYLFIIINGRRQGAGSEVKSRGGQGSRESKREKEVDIRIQQAEGWWVERECS